MVCYSVLTHTPERLVNNCQGDLSESVCESERMFVALRCWRCTSMQHPWDLEAHCLAALYIAQSGSFQRPQVTLCPRLSENCMLGSQPLAMLASDDSSAALLLTGQRSQAYCLGRSSPSLYDCLAGRNMAPKLQFLTAGRSALLSAVEGSLPHRIARLCIVHE